MTAHRLAGESFAGRVKSELAQIWPDERHCRLAELTGLVRTAGALERNGAEPDARHGWSLLLRTERGATARKILRLLRSLDAQPRTVVARPRRLRSNPQYVIRLPQSQHLLMEMGILDSRGRPDDTPPVSLLVKPCCLRSFARGAFLGAGSVSEPGRRYHWEIVFESADQADLVGQVLFALGLPVRLSRRGDRKVVLYLKDGQSIARWLALVGAHRALLEFEDARSRKEVANRVNRLVNAETHNVRATVSAGLDQARALARLQSTGGLQRLPPSLGAVARLRLAHPEASLAELGQMLEPPLSKSAVNHRLRRLMALVSTEPTD